MNGMGLRSLLTACTCLLLAGCFGPPRFVTHPDGVTIERDLVFEHLEDGALHLDRYRPAAAPPNEAMPTVVWIHGGGWLRGDRYPCPVAIFARDGLQVLSVEYRLSSEAQFPAQIADVLSALRYINAHADELGVDRDRIGLLGASAGGHLASLAATAADHPAFTTNRAWADSEPRIACVAAMFPLVDLDDLYERRDVKWTTRYVIRRLLGAPPAQSQSLTELADPRTHASPDDAPLLLIHGTADRQVPIDQSTKLAASLAAQGVPVELVSLLDAGHGNRLLARTEVRQALQAFFARHLTRDDRLASAVEP